MKQLSTTEKIGIALVALSLVAFILRALDVAETISGYGRYLAGIGAAVWVGGWAQRKKSEREG